MILAAAQTTPVDGNIEANVIAHCAITKMAASKGADLILFPEMSLTGYQRERASELAFTENDPRLGALKQVSKDEKIIIVAGAPIQIGTELHIGAFVIRPDHSVAIYTKQYLHDGEEIYFSPCFNHIPDISLKNQKTSIAICADIEEELHARASNCDLYLASIFYSPGGLVKGFDNLSTYAKKFNMSVLIANYAGSSWGFEAGGMSAYWNSKGVCIGKLWNDKPGLLLITKKDDTPETAQSYKFD